MSKPSSLRGAADAERVAMLGQVRQLQSAIRRGDRGSVVDAIRRLVLLRAPLAGQWLRLSQIAARNGEVTLARAAIDLYVESAKGDPGAPHRKAALLSEIGAWDEALALLRSFPAHQPDPATYAYTRGTAALFVGEWDEARSFLVEATRLNPLAGSPWLSLAVLVDFGGDAALADYVIANQAAFERASPGERAMYLYALGKVHADRAEHARAFEAFSGGAGLMKRQLAYSRERDRFTASDAVDGYDAGGISELARKQSEPTGRGIFVLGLPRSGTTLAEQILTSHSGVSDGGEIYRLGLLAQGVGGLSFDAASRFVAQNGAPRAARLWQHLLEERFPLPGRVIDKTTNSSRMLGLAATLLPEAPFVWMVRDPLDCAWSCYRTRFSGEAPWSYDFEDIAYHFRLETELLARWQAILGERLLVVPYESLVSQPEPWIRKMLTHCGLGEEPQVFAPHENPRVAATASMMQVRKPINRNAIGAAEPYRQFLQPFVEAYPD